MLEMKRNHPNFRKARNVWREMINIEAVTSVRNQEGRKKGGNLQKSYQADRRKIVKAILSLLE
jgi:hypothetical protein